MSFGKGNPSLDAIQTFGATLRETGPYCLFRHHDDGRHCNGVTIIGLLLLQETKPVTQKKGPQMRPLLQPDAKGTAIASIP